MSIEEYLRAINSNSESPHPIAIGFADTTIEQFMTGFNFCSPFSALKIFNFAWSGARAATYMSRCGLAHHTAPVTRQSLESLVYGVLFARRKEFHDLWKQRHNSQSAKEKFRKRGFSTGLDEFEKCSPGTKAAIKSHYASLIDTGAHPNVIPLTLSSELHWDSKEEIGYANLLQISSEPAQTVALSDIAFNYKFLL